MAWVPVADIESATSHCAKDPAGAKFEPEIITASPPSVAKLEMLVPPGRVTDEIVGAEKDVDGDDDDWCAIVTTQETRAPAPFVVVH
jgi:hypothetical protein